MDQYHLVSICLWTLSELAYCSSTHYFLEVNPTLNPMLTASAMQLPPIVIRQLRSPSQPARDLEVLEDTVRSQEITP